MLNELNSLLNCKKILILGFGREGVSTYNYLTTIIQPDNISIADQDMNLKEKIGFEIHPACSLYLGENYLDNLEAFDVIIKSPGISPKLFKSRNIENKITSQTELFLKVYSRRTIGVTGTKGKSTTSSLIKHILADFYKDALLVGNIGVPPFDLIQSISPETKIVFELSSHQLEQVSVSPFIAVLLNLYEEHLDHYDSYRHYQLAKFNITRFQKEEDWVVMNCDNSLLCELYEESNLKRRRLVFSQFPISDQGSFIDSTGEIVCRFGESESRFDFKNRVYLPGDHNLMNIMAAICVAKIMEVPDQYIYQSVKSFKGLKHRMELVGTYKGIIFYNDSISTIPQATILAVQSLKSVDTLILGGKDRGIDYSPLIRFLPESGVSNLIFIGEAGKRIRDGLEKMQHAKNQRLFTINQIHEISELIRLHTKPGAICLLSPAAASYDQFKNFEERGEVFKKIAENI